LKLSTKGKYALYAMHYLALKSGEGPQPLKSIAEMGVPEQYLEQLLGNLRRAGLLKTVRGAQGGYELAKAPTDITVGDIIEATEGPISLSDCLSETAHCAKSGSCAARGVWDKLTNSINDLLQGISLEDMLKQGKEGVAE
jgi:Rrf2 family protein